VRLEGLGKLKKSTKTEYRSQDEVLVSEYQAFWMNKRSTLKSEHQTLVRQYPESNAQLKQLFTVLSDIEDMERHITDSAGDGAEWDAIVNAAEEYGASYCNGLHGKPHFSALYGTYTVKLQGLNARTLADQTNLPKTTENQKTSPLLVVWGHLHMECPPPQHAATVG
jgi:hypothetical protein